MRKGLKKQNPDEGHNVRMVKGRGAREEKGKS